MPADAAAAQRLLPVAPAPGRDGGPRAGGLTRRRDCATVAWTPALARPASGAYRQALAARHRLRAMLLGVDVGGTFTDAVLVAMTGA